MSSTGIRWYNQDKTIILREGFSLVSLELIYARQKELFVMLDGVDHTVDIIMMIHEPHLFQQWVPSLRRWMNTIHPHQGMMVIVNARNFTKEVFSIVGKLYRKEAVSWHFAATLEEAEQFLRDLRKPRLD